MRLKAILLLLVATLPAAAEDYLIVFAADSTPYAPKHTHTFAAIVRVEKEPGAPPRVVKLDSLSWLPRSGTVRVMALRSEPGRNVPLDETLRDCVASGCRVHVWGPYQVQPELTEMFRNRIAMVESCFEYKGACLTSRRTICDCARSVEELIGPRRYIGLFGYGAAAASNVVQIYSPWIVNPEQTHPWVGPLIGLEEYPLTYRPFGDYTTRMDQWKTWIRR